MKTVGELYGPAMKVTKQAEADAHFKMLVADLMEAHTDMDRWTAEAMVRKNLGYYAGYYDSETRRRVEKLFKCEHPVLGSIEENGEPTIEEAFKMGVAMGTRAREEG